MPRLCGRNELGNRRDSHHACARPDATRLQEMLAARIDGQCLEVDKPEPPATVEMRLYTGVFTPTSVGTFAVV